MIPAVNLKLYDLPSSTFGRKSSKVHLSALAAARALWIANAIVVIDEITTTANPNSRNQFRAGKPSPTDMRMMINGVDALM